MDASHDEDWAWCVDFGRAIEVMTTSALRAKIEAGSLGPTTKVWRDGRPCWQRAHEVAELGPAPRRCRTYAPSATPRERARPGAGVHLRRGRPGPGLRRRTHAFSSAFFAGLLIGGTLGLPFVLSSGPTVAAAEKGLATAGPLALHAPVPYHATR